MENIVKKRSFILIYFILMLTFIFLFFSNSCKSAPRERTSEDIYDYLREQMVQNQIIERDIKDKRVIEAMSKIPRHIFIPDENKKHAYDDTPVSIGEGQTISQPFVVALMTEKLELNESDKVLEIGTGSGYQAAVLAEIVEQVYTVEIIPALYERAKAPLSSYSNIKMSNHDGYYGWEEFSPFDKIIVTAAPDHIPPPLISQLKDKGIMVIPVGPPGWNQVLWKVVKEGDEVKTIHIAEVVFVPLTRSEE